MIELTPSIKRDINNAFADGQPIVICAVTPEAEPTVSYRGTAQTYGDDAIAFWVRDRDNSATLRSIAVHPVLVAIYTNMPARRFYTLRGRARLETDPAVLETVYENSHPAEQQRDPERKGVAVIVELDSVRGRGEDGPVQMARDS